MADAGRMTSVRALGPLERAFVNRYQGGFPIVGRPFSQVAAELGSDENTLLAMVAGLLHEGWLSRFGPLYNPERIGGAVTLAALSAPEDRFDAVAAEVNDFPEVAHNYRRDHVLNMWFVVASDRRERIGVSLRRIEEAVGLKVFNFPKRREFYLGLRFELTADGVGRTRPIDPPSWGSPRPLTALDRRIVAATQAGLPLVPEPCARVAEQVGAGTAEVTQRIQEMLHSGAIRRIGAVPNHYRLGFRGNGMSVWEVPVERLERVGRRLAAMDCVSHCYARPPAPPLWPYNLFAMVHGRDRPEVSAQVGHIAALLGSDCPRHELLFSSAVLKKTGLRLAA